MRESMFKIEEGERQMILLAIAELALTRPGWDWCLGELAEKLSGREMFEGFKVTSSDRVKPADFLRLQDPTPKATTEGTEVTQEAK